MLSLLLLEKHGIWPIGLLVLLSFLLLFLAVMIATTALRRFIWFVKEAWDSGDGRPAAR